MQLLELGTNRVLIDLTDSPKLYDFIPLFFGERSQSYRRGDVRLVTNDSKKHKAELRFEFQRLTPAEVDTLEAIYRSREPFICIPDPIDEPEKKYAVRWVSSFDRSDTVVTDWTQGRSLQAVFRTVDDPNIHTPAVRIEIEGVDVTDRRIPRDGLTVGKSLDYPELLTYRSSGVSFNLDNEDGAFDYSNPDNFFVSNGLPAHGRGAKVLVELGLSKNELMPVFAGEISEVVTSLGSTKARIKTRDLSVRSRQKVIENFGTELTRPITDYEGVAIDYTSDNPVFYFPIWGLPISPNSVSLIVNGSDGTDIDINIVDAIKTEGVLSNRNAEIDYARGLIRFEAEPDDGAETKITATWKRDYRYKRPDYLIRQLLKNTGIQDTIGITDDRQARFAIEQALVRHPTDSIFTSHGRPFFEREGIVRWLKYNADSKWFMSIDTRLVEYDEYQDEYSELSEIPDDQTIEEAPPGGYGTKIEGEAISFNSVYTFCIHNNQLYASGSAGSTASQGVSIYDLNGTLVTRNAIRVPGRAPSDGLGRGSLRNQSIYDIKIMNNQLFMLYGYTIGNSGTTAIAIIDLSPNPRPTRFISARTIIDAFGQTFAIRRIAVTPDRIILANEHRVYFIDHEGNPYPSEGFDFPTDFTSPQGLDATANFIYALENENPPRPSQSLPAVDNNIRVFTYGGTEVANRRFLAQPYRNSNTRGRGLQVIGNKLYTHLSDSRSISVFSIVADLNYHSFVPYQFDFYDSRYVYVLSTNTFTGDVLVDTTFNRVRIYKYDRDQDLWIILLDPDKGQPQLAAPYDFINENKILADNRKNFQVIRRNNKTLMFYRRVQAGSASIAMYNETDDAITNIYTEAFSGDNRGLPYSMDFWVDQRAASLHVYTFVVNYTFSGGNFSSATLKVYRKQVQPLGTQAEIFSETFSATSGDDLYPVSVSDLILADDRTKWYFTLDYQSEADAHGKAELCELPKDEGTRVVRKTYTNPLLGPRSPARVGNRYFYLEGGWVRMPKSDPSDDTLPADERHYPNEGGHLIEIESNGDITDHGIVWRSRSKLDSPDPDPENAQYDGWGLHNAVVSNMVADNRENLRFVAGYGLPYRINNNLPTAEITGAIPDETNFNWIQFGQDLSTKIASFPTSGRRGWELIQQLAQLMNWEIGFGPNARKVDAIQATNPSISDWSANASFFFRPRTILPAKLRTAITVPRTPTTIEINDSGLPAEISEFPVPPVGGQYAVVIGKEMFTYTGVNPNSQGRVLAGVQRGRNGSTAAAHSVDAAVYFVDYFASGEVGTTLVAIQNRSLDFVNLKNDVSVGFGDTAYNAKDQVSIDENGEKTFNLGTSQPLLSRQDQVWAQLIGDIYLKELKDIKEVIQFTLVFSPMLQPGQLVVAYQMDRVRIEFKLFRLLQMQHHTFPRWQTQVTALEIIP